jgi:hypothetical protein
VALAHPQNECFSNQYSANPPSFDSAEEYRTEGQNDPAGALLNLGTATRVAWNAVGDMRRFAPSALICEVATKEPV